jgi:ribA/ribD-fused uncharacterized protein
MERKPIITPYGIFGFFGEYRFLSNFELCSVTTDDGRIYTSSEAAYMAQKTNDLTTRDKFTKLSPKEARQFGQTIPLKWDWNNYRLIAMFDVTMRKYTQNPELKNKLLATQNKYLEETNDWQDNFWGKDPSVSVVDSTGVNMLGKTIMAVRGILRSNLINHQVIHQWRKIGTSPWWDGFPDNEDGRGPYETRTLYLERGL